MSGCFYLRRECFVVVLLVTIILSCVRLVLMAHVCISHMVWIFSWCCALELCQLSKFHVNVSRRSGALIRTPRPIRSSRLSGLHKLVILLHCQYQGNTTPISTWMHKGQLNTFERRADDAPATRATGSLWRVAPAAAPVTNSPSRRPFPLVAWMWHRTPAVLLYCNAHCPSLGRPMHTEAPRIRASLRCPPLAISSEVHIIGTPFPSCRLRVALATTYRHIVLFWSNRCLIVTWLAFTAPCSRHARHEKGLLSA